LESEDLIRTAVPLFSLSVSFQHKSVERPRLSDFDFQSCFLFCLSSTNLRCVEFSVFFHCQSVFSICEKRLINAVINIFLSPADEDNGPHFTWMGPMKKACGLFRVRWLIKNSLRQLSALQIICNKFPPTGQACTSITLAQAQKILGPGI